MIPISNSTKNIPGRNSTATNQLIFNASLPALGFNTYFFEAKSNIFFILPLHEKMRNFFLANQKSKVKITQNDACILQNQVRQQNEYVTYILSAVL